jgi:hypothetical protein
MRQKIAFLVLTSFVLASLPCAAETRGGPPLVGAPAVRVLPNGAQLPAGPQEQSGRDERSIGITMVAIGLCVMVAGLYFVHHGNETDARSASYGLPGGWSDSGEDDRKDGYFLLGLGGISAGVGAILWGVGQSNIDAAEAARGPRVAAGWTWHF